MSQKGATNTMAVTLSNLDRFANYFTSAKSTNFTTKRILVYPPQLTYVAAYLRKLKNQNFALFVHVKHVSNMTYHLFNRYLSNVIKIRAKIITLQNINILLFVRSPSLTIGLKLCS